MYVLTREGLALCLSAETGKPEWERDLAKATENGLPPFGCGSSPVVEGGLALLNVGKNGVALDARSGEVAWNSGPGMAGHASPVVLPGGRAAFFTGSGLVGVEIRTGKRLWQYPWTVPGNICAIDPIVRGDHLFLTGYLRGVRLHVDEASVRELYETRALRSSFNNPVLVGPYLFGSDRGALVCVDWLTGAEKWRRDGILAPGAKPQAQAFSGPPPAEGGMIAAGKHLLVLDGGGTLHVLDAAPDGCRERARAHLLDGPCWTAPVLANGVLYCRNNEGGLTAVDVGRR